MEKVQRSGNHNRTSRNTQEAGSSIPLPDSHKIKKNQFLDRGYFNMTDLWMGNGGGGGGGGIFVSMSYELSHPVTAEISHDLLDIFLTFFSLFEHLRKIFQS